MLFGDRAPRVGRSHTSICADRYDVKPAAQALTSPCRKERQLLLRRLLRRLAASEVLDRKIWVGLRRSSRPFRGARGFGTGRSQGGQNQPVKNAPDSGRSSVPTLTTLPVNTCGGMALGPMPCAARLVAGCYSMVSKSGLGKVDFKGLIMRRRLVPAAALFAVLAAVSSHSMGMSPQEVFMEAAPSTVMVFAGNRSGAISVQGSGVVVAADKVVTNCHVVLQNKAPLKEIRIRQGAVTTKGELLASYIDYDTCLLQVSERIGRPIRIADTSKLAVGQRVYAIGAPSGLELTLTEGLLSGLRIDDRGSKIIQTSAQISPGSSGGGLFDDRGQLIGITSFTLGQGNGLSFAYQASAIFSVMVLARQTRDWPNALSASIKGGRRSAADSFPPDYVLAVSSLEAKRWIDAMSERLSPGIADQDARIQFLTAVHYEATRAGLDPQLVLGLIDAASGFQRDSHGVPAGALGYMRVSPKWVEVIGYTNDDLLETRTNLRYGCTILRHYLDLHMGDLYLALAHYERSMKDGPWAGLGNKIDGKFPNLVRKTWKTEWLYN